MSNIWIREPPYGLEHIYNEIFSKDAIKFLMKLVDMFDYELDQVLQMRKKRNLEIKEKLWSPIFKNTTTNLKWEIASLPHRLRNRKIDLGDISPANTPLFIDALKSTANGVQVDFDDGHCPTWRNTIKGFQNIILYANSKLPDIPDDITKCPLLMFRPRAFNMIEHNCMINGKEVNGALFDFALIVYHVGRIFEKLEIGPYFYLSKIEGSNETKLWNSLFNYVEEIFKFSNGTIRACVLIENILAAFEMEDILYSLKDHAIGLNCGIWDYCASIISKFGDYESMILSDRRQTANTKQPFIFKYMLFLINTCHRRRAIATAGMAPNVLPKDKTSHIYSEILDVVRSGKENEIIKGFDGFIIFDFRLLDEMFKLWKIHCQTENQIHVLPIIDLFTGNCLVKIPKGECTMEELRYNLQVSMYFIFHWLAGQGIFFFNNKIEDSATAEIARLQLWQWIRHSIRISDKNNKNFTIVNRQLIEKELDKLYKSSVDEICRTPADVKRMSSAKYILIEIITSKIEIEFLTSFLNDNHKFRSLHNKSDSLKSKI